MDRLPDDRLRVLFCASSALASAPVVPPPLAAQAEASATAIGRARSPGARLEEAGRTFESVPVEVILFAGGRDEAELLAPEIVPTE